MTNEVGLARGQGEQTIKLGVSDDMAAWHGGRSQSSCVEVLAPGG
jgi:hypothetical protein